MIWKGISDFRQAEHTRSGKEAADCLIKYFIWFLISVSSARQSIHFLSSLSTDLSSHVYRKHTHYFNWMRGLIFAHESYFPLLFFPFCYFTNFYSRYNWTLLWFILFSKIYFFFVIFLYTFFVPISDIHCNISFVHLNGNCVNNVGDNSRKVM